MSYKDFKENIQGDFKYLIDRGLSPSSVFLDVGCCRGRLAGAIDYLEKGNYFGFDKEPDQIKLYNQSLKKRKDLLQKGPNISCFTLLEYFNNVKLNRKFDFVYGYSVLTHIMIDDNLEFFKKLKQNTNSNASMYFTVFLLSEESKLQYLKGEKHKFRKEEMDCVWYSKNYFSNFFDKLGFDVKFLGDDLKNWEGKNRIQNLTRYNEKVLSPFRTESIAWAGHYDHQDMVMITHKK